MSVYFMQHIAQSLLERLDWICFEPRKILICGQSALWMQDQLVQRFPQAHIAVGHETNHAPADLVVAHCTPPAEVHQWMRLVHSGGLLLFALPGPESLHELCVCAQTVQIPWKHHCSDVHTLAHTMQELGFAHAVLDVEHHVIHYERFKHLVRALKDAPWFDGDHPVLDCGMWRRLIAQYRTHCTWSDGSIFASLEIIYGHGWFQPPQEVWISSITKRAASGNI